MTTTNLGSLSHLPLHFFSNAIDLHQNLKKSQTNHKLNSVNEIHEKNQKKRMRYIVDIRQQKKILLKSDNLTFLFE